MRLTKQSAASLVTGLALLLTALGAGASLLAGMLGSGELTSVSGDHAVALPTLSTWALMTLALVLVVSTGWMLASQRSRGG